MAAQPVSTSIRPDKANEDDVVIKQDELSNENLLDESQFASNPFADPSIAEHYRKIYEDAKYECRHVFDPDLEWEPAEEKKLIRKLDWHVCLWACVMFFALQVDRSNIVQAVSGNMLDQLGLSTNDYNNGTGETTNRLEDVADIAR